MLEPSRGDAPPTTCPFCKRPSTPAAGLITCGCGKSFVQRAGPLMDPSVHPAPRDPKAKAYKLKSAGLFVVNAAFLKGDAIGYGALDPIVGAFPMDDKGIAFEFIYSVTVWRERNTLSMVRFFVGSLPLMLMALLGIVASAMQGSPVGLLCGAPFLIWGGYHAYMVFKVQATRTVVVGLRNRTFDMTFAGSWKKRQQFHDAFFERLGVGAVPLP